MPETERMRGYTVQTFTTEGMISGIIGSDGRSPQFAAMSEQAANAFINEYPGREYKAVEITDPLPSYVKDVEGNVRNAVTWRIVPLTRE